MIFSPGTGIGMDKKSHELAHMEQTEQERAALRHLY